MTVQGNPWCGPSHPIMGLATYEFQDDLFSTYGCDEAEQAASAGNLTGLCAEASRRLS